VKLRRRHLEHLERVEQLWNDDAAKRAVAVAWFAGFSGFQASDLTRDAGISPDQIEGVVAGLLSAGTVAELTLPPNRKLLVHMDRVTELGERLLAVVGVLHAEFPLMTNHERSKALSRLDYIGDEPLLNAVVDRLIKQKQLVGDARRIARADFKPKLSAAQRKLKDKMVDDHKKAAFQPPEASSYANQVGGNATTLRDIFEVAVAEGFLVRVTDEIYLHSDADADMRKRVTDKLSEVPAGLTVADIRDLLGTTRKYAVPLCEFLDKSGLTKRNGDLRVKA
jgi:selenocysteine-specific elongation factor